MFKFVSLILLTILSLSFLGKHNYFEASVPGNHSITASYATNDISAQKNDNWQEETKGLLHKHCSISCFIIPPGHSAVRFSLKKNITVSNAEYIELVLASRLKRPPRKSV